MTERSGPPLGQQEGEEHLEVVNACVYDILVWLIIYQFHETINSKEIRSYLIKWKTTSIYHLTTHEFYYTQTMKDENLELG